MTETNQMDDKVTDNSAKGRQSKVVEGPGSPDQTFLESFLSGGEGSAKNRIDRIKESHVLLRQFTAKELKTLLNLKRNTSPKAWTLREDLVVLTLPLSNREIAEILKDRNKEAVKKRLQLLRSKGLTKRAYEPPPKQQPEAGT